MKERIAKLLRRIADRLCPEPEVELKTTLIFQGDLGLHIKIGSGGFSFYKSPEFCEMSRCGIEGDVISFGWDVEDLGELSNEGRRCIETRARNIM
jgi:hypothetical protein